MYLKEDTGKTIANLNEERNAVTILNLYPDFFYPWENPDYVPE